MKGGDVGRVYCGELDPSQSNQSNLRYFIHLRATSLPLGRINKHKILLISLTTPWTSWKANFHVTGFFPPCLFFETLFLQWTILQIWLGTWFLNYKLYLKQWNKANDCRSIKNFGLKVIKWIRIEKIMTILMNLYLIFSLSLWIRSHEIFCRIVVFNLYDSIVHVPTSYI